MAPGLTYTAAFKVMQNIDKNSQKNKGRNRVSEDEKILMCLLKCSRALHPVLPFKMIITVRSCWVMWTSGKIM